MSDRILGCRGNVYEVMAGVKQDESYSRYPVLVGGLTL